MNNNDSFFNYTRTPNISETILKHKYYDRHTLEYQDINYIEYKKKNASEETYINIPSEVIMITSFLLLSTPAKRYLRMYRKFAAVISQKFIVILLGIPFGILNAYQVKVAYFCNIMKIYPTYYYNIYLPIVIFYVSYETDFHIVARCWHQILIIGGIRYIIDAAIVGLIMSRVVFGDWVFAEDLLFGFIITPVMPFGNMDNMKRLSKFKHIGYLLDSDAILGYVISNSVVKNLMIYLTDETCTISYISLMFLIDLGAGFLVGIIVGKISCFLIDYFRSNSFHAILFTVASNMFTYSICLFTHICAPLAVLINALCIGHDRQRFVPDVDKYIAKFWSTSFYICELYLLFTMSSVTVERLIIYSEINYHVTILSYVISSASRLATFIFFMPILSRLGYGLNIRCTLALAMAANKDVVNMLLANALLYYSNSFYVATYCISHVFACTVLSHLFNNTQLNRLIKALGLTEVSIARKINMDNCMRHIMDKRSRYLATLKTHRFLSDANWSVVDTGTFLKHPYGKPVSREDAEDEWTNRKAQCPDCERVFFVELTEKERVHVKREIFQRILKTQKISFIRQVEEGVLSKDANTILLHAIEIAVESTDCIINSKEIFKPFHKKSPLHFLKRCLTTHSSKRRELYHTPRRAYRRVLHNIVSSMYFEICVYIFIFLSCVPVIYEMCVSLDESSIEMFWINISYGFALLLYWTEYVMKVLAYSWVFISDGFRNYYRSIWNIIDFTIIILCTLDVTAIIIYYICSGGTYYIPEEYFDIVRSIRLFRLVRLLTIFRGLIPKVLQYVEARIEVKLALGFDIGKGLMVSYEDVSNALEQIIGDVTLQNEVKITIELLNQEILKELTKVTKDRPWIAIAVKTRQCIRSVLKHLNDGIKYLKKSGNIDDIEFGKINAIVERNAERLNYLKQIPQASPKILFNEILWMNGDQRIIDFFFNYAEVVVFEKEETIFEDGQKADGVYLIIEGMAHLRYGSKEEGEASITETGKLPIIDYVSRLRFDEKINEVIMRGNTFGELSVLTDRPYSCTLYTDANSSCKCYYISTNVIREAFRIFNDPVCGLMCQMWKYSTLQLSFAVLQEVPIYQLMSIHEIKTHLVRSFIADLSNFRNFIFIELIEDLILLDGRIVDESTKTVYFAPSYIPRTVRRFSSDIEEYADDDDDDDGLQCKILIIPMEDVNEYDIIEKVEDLAALVDMFADNLVTGTEAARLSKRQKKKANKFRSRPMNQMKAFGGLRSQLESLSLFDEEELRSQLNESTRNKKISVFFTKPSALQNLKVSDD